MAERYPPGLNRLWYRATGFSEGVDAVGDFRGPGGIRETGLMFTEDGDGLYYLDYNFPVVGSYVIVIYEDGVKRTTQSFLVEKPSSIKRGTIGSNILNT